MVGDKIHAGLLRNGWAWDVETYSKPVPFAEHLTLWFVLKPLDPPTVQNHYGRSGPWTLWVEFDDARAAGVVPLVPRRQRIAWFAGYMLLRPLGDGLE